MIRVLYPNNIIGECVHFIANYIIMLIIIIRISGSQIRPHRRPLCPPGAYRINTPNGSRRALITVLGNCIKRSR